MDILCGGCGKQLKVDDGLAGSEYACEYCGRVIRVPSLEEEQSPAGGEGFLGRGGADQDLTSDFITKARLALKKKLLVVCGNCEERLTVEQRLAGRVVRCPSCGEEIRIPAPIEEEALAPEELMTDVAETPGTLDLGEQVPALADQLTAALSAAPHAARAHPIRPRRRPPVPQRRSPAVLGLILMVVAVLAGLGGLLVGFAVQDSGPPSPPEEPRVDSRQPPAPRIEPDPGGLVSPAPAPSPRPMSTDPGLDEPSGHSRMPLPTLKQDPPKPGASGRLSVGKARLSLLAGGGDVPAPLGKAFLQAAVQMVAGEESLTVNTATGDVVAESDQGKFPAIGVPANHPFLALGARGAKMTIPPTASRVETFLFVVPPDISGGRIKVAGLAETKLPPLKKLSTPPAKALVGIYAESSRRLKLGFSNPGMEQVRTAPRHRMVITSQQNRFGVKMPPTKLTGEAKHQGSGTYEFQLACRGGGLTCHLRLLAGGDCLVLYLDKAPYHQIIYRRQ